MPLSDWELWACANEMIRQHGASAADRAGARSAALEEGGDRQGSATWGLIERRIIELLKKDPAAGTWLH